MLESHSTVINNYFQVISFYRGKESLACTGWFEHQLLLDLGHPLSLPQMTRHLSLPSCTHLPRPFRLLASQCSCTNAEQQAGMQTKIKHFKTVTTKMKARGTQQNGWTNTSKLKGSLTEQKDFTLTHNGTSWTHNGTSAKRNWSRKITEAISIKAAISAMQHRAAQQNSCSHSFAQHDWHEQWAPSHSGCSEQESSIPRWWKNPICWLTQCRPWANKAKSPLRGHQFHALPALPEGFLEAMTQLPAWWQIQPGQTSQRKPACCFPCRKLRCPRLWCDTPEDCKAKNNMQWTCNEHAMINKMTLNRWCYSIPKTWSGLT